MTRPVCSHQAHTIASNTTILMTLLWALSSAHTIDSPIQLVCAQSHTISKCESNILSFQV
jgi:hypothetical protein